MADEKVTAGQPLSQSPLRRAAFVNDVVDTVKDFRSRRLGEAKPSFFETVSTDRLGIQNLTGSDLVRGNVVQLGAYLLDNDDDDGPDPRSLWFEGNTPADPAEKRWAILVAPLKSEEIGSHIAQLSGVCVALVNITDTGHTFAKPVSGNVVLQSSSDPTPIEIISPVTASGEDTYAVRLGGGGGADNSFCPTQMYTADEVVIDDISTDDLSVNMRPIRNSSGTIIGYCRFLGRWKNDCCTTPDDGSSSSSGGGG